MTTDGIRIETQAQADAVPLWSAYRDPRGNDRPNCPDSDYIIEIGDTLTYLAGPVVVAAADRTEVVADAQQLRATADAFRGGWPDLSYTLDDIADRMEARARRTLPDVLADAWEAQQAPPTVAVELPRDVVHKIVRWEADTAPWLDVIEACLAALDAERGQG